MTISKARELLDKEGLSYTKDELAILVQMVNMGREMYQRKVFDGKTLKDLGVSIDND